jgi:hypothetical protein
MEPYGHSIFCDDIRSEAGGKLSFIGCYNAVMFASPMFPIVLQKFCVHIHIFSPATQPYRSVMVRCYVPGQDDPIANVAIDVPGLRDQQKMLAILPDNGDAPPSIVVAASLVFAPLEIIRAGMINVRALINDGPNELQLGSLQVAAAVQ